ncbi:MAG: DNA-directed RNA polymerase subunit omega [Kiritimatiellales bacterium]|nr:DNA-directed RNA polymerase subunit omega [Kiritimatiellota bacterium]MBL7012189.1 DNA-directed RNA polymerase subunit omega [Kiritimatiellales bacterium]
MNFEYLTKAQEKIGNVPTLVNLVSYRTRQLNHGARPMVKPDHPEQDNHDIVLKEIVEGKLTVEMGVEPPSDIFGNFDAPKEDGPSVIL